MSAKDINTCEPDCNAEPAGAVRDNNARQAMMFALYLCLAVASLYLLFKLCIGSGGFIGMLIDYDISFFISIIAAFLFSVSSSVIYYIHYIKRKKNEVTLQENRGWAAKKKRSLLTGCLLAVIVASLLMAVSRIVIYTYGQDIIPLAQFKSDISFPLMEQISPQEWLEANSKPDIVKLDDFVSEKSCYVAPMVLYVRQYCHGIEGVPNDDAMTYGYNFCYYEMRAEYLAVCYEKELRLNSGAGEVANIRVEGFDSAAYYVDRYGENVILRSGNVVITSFYYGAGSLLDNVDKFACVSRS